DIWLVPSSGGTPQRLTTDGGLKRSLAWQPHGSLLSFVRGDNGAGTLRTIDVRDGTQHKVGEVPPFLEQPSPWSPDGTRLAFTDAANKLTVVDADGAHLRELTTDTITGVPVWSADGAGLVVAEIRVLSNAVSGRFGPPTDVDIFTVDATTGAGR